MSNNYNRRDILKLTAACAAGLFIPISPSALATNLMKPPKRGPRKTLSIVQGATDESSTQFSIVHLAQIRTFATVISSENKKFYPHKTKNYQFKGQKSAVAHAFFTGLPTAEDLKLVIKDDKGRILDQRIFRTMDPRQDYLKFAICSCMDDEHHEPEIWNDLLAQSPDVIFFIGDSTYTDQEAATLDASSPARLWRRFCEARETLEIYHQPRLTPILAVWDDHDFGDNDTNAVEYPFVKESQRNFLIFFPQNPDYCRYLDRGPGISSAFTFGDQQILLMDDRSFRLPSDTKDRYAHWGKAQEEWALRHIGRHKNATWVMNGSQFFPSVPWKESVSRNHPQQLNGFLGQIAGSRKKVIFASGDVHYSEISRIEPEILGYETFEITSSSVHSTNFPGFPGLVPNPRRIMSTGDRNYVIVKCQEEEGKMVYKVQSRSPGSKVQFQKKIAF